MSWKYKLIESCSSQHWLLKNANKLRSKISFSFSLLLVSDYNFVRNWTLYQMHIVRHNQWDSWVWMQRGSFSILLLWLSWEWNIIVIQILWMFHPFKFLLTPNSFLKLSISILDLINKNVLQSLFTRICSFLIVVSFPRYVMLILMNILGV